MVTQESWQEGSTVRTVSPPAGEQHSTDLLADSESRPHEGVTEERQLESVRET